MVIILSNIIVKHFSVKSITIVAIFFFFFASSVTMKLVSMQHEVSTFGWLVIVKEELFVQITLAAMGVF